MREEVEFIYFVNSGKERIRVLPDSPLISRCSSSHQCMPRKYVCVFEMKFWCKHQQWRKEKYPESLCRPRFCAEHLKDAAYEP